MDSQIDTGNVFRSRGLSNINKDQDKMRHQHGKGRRLHTYQVGDHVLIYDARRAGHARKESTISPMFSGPFVVANVLQKNIFVMDGGKMKKINIRNVCASMLIKDPCEAL